MDEDAGMVVEIDRNRAHASRIYDFLLGGTDNFEVDRQAAELAFSAYPGGLDAVKIDVQANRAFLERSVRYLVKEAGVRQILDIGTGIPNRNNAHEVAQAIAPDCRVVYVDNDPIVLAHAHTLLRGHPEGHTHYLNGDLLQPEVILEKASDHLNLAEPVAILLIGVMHVIPDSAGPCEAIGTLLDSVPSGSYLAISQLCSDIAAENMATVGARLESALGETNPPALRTRAEIERFFTGLELVAPGAVTANEWRPDGDTGWSASDRIIPLFCGVARKP